MEQKTVFAVIENSAIDYDESNEVYLFDSIEKAKVRKNQLIEASGIRDEITDDWVCADEDTYFEAYPDGEYCENHYIVYIKELVVR